jgi:magnesium-transporting ATPase (P-type)
MKPKQIAWLWVKMISLIILILGILAVAMSWVAGIKFDGFWMQMFLFVIAAFVGTISVYLAFRTKTIFT